MPLPLYVDTLSSRRTPVRPPNGASPPHHGHLPARRGRSAESPLRQLHASPRPARAHPHDAGTGTSAAMRYRFAIVVADFAATTDSFHRRLAMAARTVAERICLVQHPAPAGGTRDASTTEILLEGLRHRLGLDPHDCAVAADTGQLHALATPDAADVVVLGTSMVSAGSARHGIPATNGHGLHCDVLVIEDRPDWE